jgi:hypothetical protein
LSYLEKVERFFVEKRRKGLIISPRDWLVIEKWQEEGIPLLIVLKGIAETFKNVDSDAVGGKSKIHRLAYCEAEIRRLWEEKAAAPVEDGKDFSVTDSLDQVVSILQTAAADQKGEASRAISAYADEVAGMREEIAGNAVSAAEMEMRLREGLTRLAEKVLTLIDREEGDKLRQAVEIKLKDYRSSMEPEAYNKTFAALLRERVLESLGISELSVFS